MLFAASRGYLIAVAGVALGLLAPAESARAKPAPGFSLVDPKGDDDGPGGYRYPPHRDYAEGAFDLVGVQVIPGRRDVEVRLTFATDVTDPWDAQSWGGPPFSLQLVHVYLDTGEKRRRGDHTSAFAGFDAQVGEEPVWDKVILISAEDPKVIRRRLKREAKRRDVVLPKSIVIDGATIIATVKRRDLGGKPVGSWQIGVAVGGTDPFRSEAVYARAVAESASATVFGGAKGDCAPAIMDVLAASRAAQRKALAYTCGDGGRTAVIPLQRLDGRARGE